MYNAHWSTAGGGEKYAAGAASVLSRAHEVVLLAHEPVDLAWLGERLSVDLGGVGVEVIDPCQPLQQASASFDVLVNQSYRDHGRSGACRGIYVVHFPDRPGDSMAGWQHQLQRWAGPVLRKGRARVEIIGGFHEPDAIRWQEVRWSDGHGVLRVPVPSFGPPVAHLWLGRFVPGGAVRHVSASIDGELVATVDLRPPRSKLEVVEPLRVDLPLSGRGRGGSVLVELTSEASIADDDLHNGDRRRLGVPLVAVTSGRRPFDVIRARASLLAADPPGTAWLDSYDVVVANSGFTRTWITRLWGRDSVVAEPPVTLRTPGPKARRILSVGRFFAPGRGHSKKQLALVQAFRQLVDEGLEGWELHLVGGCAPEDRSYLEDVRSAAAGAPVVLHVGASGAELDELYGSASIYWHATGVGEDLDADPERAEHFGITVVEAMSAGAVPIVFSVGGPADAITDGVDGLTFVDIDGLVSATSALIGDRERRDRMAQAAIVSARRYGPEAFAARWTALVEAP